MLNAPLGGETDGCCRCSCARARYDLHSASLTRPFRFGELCEDVQHTQLQTSTSSTFDDPARKRRVGSICCTKSRRRNPSGSEQDSSRRVASGPGGSPSRELDEQAEPISGAATSATLCAWGLAPRRGLAAPACSTSRVSGSTARNRKRPCGRAPDIAVTNRSMLRPSRHQALRSMMLFQWKRVEMSETGAAATFSISSAKRIVGSVSCSNRRASLFSAFM